MVCIEKRPHILYGRSSAPHFRYLTCLLDRGHINYPAEVVKSRFMKLDSSHIEYVLSSMQENTTYVRNIKKYLLAALYNAPSTISSYYTSLVNHDLYGGGERR